MNRLLGLACGLFACFAALHVLGGREAVSVLSGTVGGGPAWLLFGLAYALAWFSAVLAAPVLLLAGLAEAALASWRRPPPTSAPE